MGYPKRPPTVPKLLSVQAPEGESQIKALLAMATGAENWG